MDNIEQKFEDIEKELRSILFEIKENGPYGIHRSADNKRSFIKLEPDNNNN